jgi:2,4-dienoyl-CoA reductase-like NADH-dependent reductase (Old Yellow Enzyme family)
VPKTFCIGIKLNSADHSRSDFEDTMTQIRLISEANVDFLEISGGTYEDPTVSVVPDILYLEGVMTCTDGGPYDELIWIC